MTAALGMLQMASQLMGNRHQDMFNRKAANVAFDRQNMLRNTAHQAEVADLRAAGLNPILSATGGGGASTPSVGASSSTGSQGVDFAGASAKSAQATLLAKETEKVEQDIANSKSQAAMYDATADRERETANDLRQYNTAFGGTHRAVQHSAHANQSYQQIRESEQTILESAERIKKIGSEMTELAARSNLHGSNISLNKATKGRLIEDMAYVQQNVRLSKYQQEQIQMAMDLLRNKVELAKSDVGKVTDVVKEMLPILELMSRNNDSPGVRLPNQYRR